MKLSVRSLGCIKNADMEIAPLTIFVGPNNTNKTWSAYALYGLVRSVITPWSISSEYYDLVSSDQPLKQNIERAVGRVISSLTAAGEAASSSAEVSREELLQGVTFPLRLTGSAPLFGWLLGMPLQPVGSAAATLELSSDEMSNRIGRVAFTLEKLQEGTTLTILLISPGGHQNSITARLPANSSEPLLRSHIQSHVGKLVAVAYENVIGFPAERKALSSVYSLMSRDHAGEQNLSRPVTDFIDFLERASWTVSTSSHSQLSNVANDLEQRVLGGNVTFESAGSPRRRMEYRIPSGSAIGIHAASSLVKSLGALDIYLRMFAHANDLVIIDEPEMNAHPGAQLAIAELLAILVNRGLRTVVTTHSPYIVDHLKNLMELSASNAEVRDAFASKLRLGSAKAFISPDKVAVYLFDSQGNVVPILDREQRLIDWSTFSNTSEEVANLYADILEANRRR